MIKKIIENYTKSKGLSQNQLAAMLNISSTHLSDIKTGKRRLSLDKIISICDRLKVRSRVREEIIAEYNFDRSEKYKEKMVQKQMLSEASMKLVSNLEILYNAFLDIHMAGKQGLTEGYLKDCYGFTIVKRLDYLIKRKVLKKIDRKYFSLNNDDLMLSPESTFRMVKSLVENEETAYQSGEHLGRTRCYTADLDEKGYRMYYEAIEEFAKKMKAIEKEHHKPVKNGGRRIGVFAGFTVLQKLFTLFLIFLTFVIFSLNLNLIAIPGVGSGTDAGDKGGGGDDGGERHSKLEDVIPRLREMSDQMYDQFNYDFLDGYHGTPLDGYFYFSPGISEEKILEEVEKAEETEKFDLSSNISKQRLESFFDMTLRDSGRDYTIKPFAAMGAYLENELNQPLDQFFRSIIILRGEEAGFQHLDDFAAWEGDFTIILMTEEGEMIEWQIGWYYAG